MFYFLFLFLFLFHLLLSASSYPAHLDAKLDEAEVQQLNRAVSQHEDVEALRAKAMCLSPVTFGLLVAVLVSVLLISLITVAVLCLRTRNSGKVNVAN